MLRFAPLNTPIHRRLETLATIVTQSTFFVFLMILVWCYFTPLTYPFLLGYYIYIYTDKAPEKGGRRFKWIRKWSYWKYLRDYFPCKLISETKLDPQKTYIMGYHPHGIISVGLWINFCTEANDVSKVFPGIKIHPLTLILNFRMPFWRDYLLSCGLCSVSRRSIEHILKKKGHAALLVPGGAREALDAHPGTNDLTLQKRRGFIKAALNNGADLVPVFSFGENDIFYQVTNKEGSAVRKWQHWFLRQFGFAPCLPYGRGIFQYDFGILPNRRPIVTVVGTPIPVPKTPHPSEELIEEYQRKYIESLQALYDKYKDEYAKERVRDMEIIR